ncbi:MAG: hypothetical protein HC817_14690 [Saprospiraceae bacterium]|nr:hypothetical protein [Saprospiraceae bacterium]
MASFARYGKYVTKHLTFARHFEHKTKDTFFAFFDTPSVSAAIMVGVLVFSVLGLIFYKKMTPYMRLIHLNFALFSVLLVPVLSFFFSWTLLSENDRYGYIPSAFLMIGTFLALSRLPKALFYAISVVYLLFSSYLLIKTNRIWWKSERVINNCLATFRWWDADEVFVLSAPDNYRGIPMFRSDWVSSTLAEGIESRHQRKLKPRLYDVMQYNMTTPADGVNVIVESDSVLVVTLNQWGNWWFKKGIGATSFDTPDFSVKMISTVAVGVLNLF